MKNILLFIFISLIFTEMKAQNEETIAISNDACGCIDEIDLTIPKSEQYEKIKSCISSSILSYQLMESLQSLPEAKNDQTSDPADILKDTSKDSVQEINIEIVTDKNYKEIEAYSLRNCPSMKRLMASDNKMSESSITDKKKAMVFYNKGQQYFEEGKYGNAVVEFSKAVKKDKNFAFAWDNLGLSYRKQGQLKQAIESYKKSLEIDPTGSLPLMNIPVAYEMMKDYDNAIKSYENLISIYPDDPEGYYGIGRMYHAKGNYEKALDNMMQAYLLYKNQISPYLHDAESNITLIYQDLEAKGQLEIFNKIAKKYDIKIEE